MVSSINSHEDNTFYNYRTPLIDGENVSVVEDTYLNGLFSASSGLEWYQNGDVRYLRFLAPELESASGTIASTSDVDQRVSFSIQEPRATLNARGSVNALYAVGNTLTSTIAGVSTTNVTFAVVNHYCFCAAVFSNDSLTDLIRFLYMGWLREPIYTGGADTVIRGLCAISFYNSTLEAFRVDTPNVADLSVPLSTADDVITNPPITCGGDASDIILRDSAAPNYAVGKLYNCVSLPATAQIGQLWKNTGPDPDTGLAHTSNNTDKYLVVMPWGGRKLGMRIWTEGFV